MAEEPLARSIGKLLVKKQMTLALCESCTGGMLGAMITAVPGSSRFFVGGIIAYSDTTKKKIVGVKSATLKRFGAVSAEVAKEMASGVKTRMLSDVAIAITGIAGPSGGTKEKPVGLVYVGLAMKRRVRAFRFMFKGGRQTVRKSACKQALVLLRKMMRNL
jgi:nicotinamide-nucleotide amidase